MQMQKNGLGPDHGKKERKLVKKVSFVNPGQCLHSAPNAP